MSKMAEFKVFCIVCVIAEINCDTRFRLGQSLVSIVIESGGKQN